MQRLRFFIFGFFGFIGVLFLLFGSLFLNRKQSRKLSLLLEEATASMQSIQKEPSTIEDILFLEDAQLTQDMYKKGTNKDLTIECRICGDNTPRGNYYALKDCTSENLSPHCLICEDCYNNLPEDREDFVAIREMLKED